MNQLAVRIRTPRWLRLFSINIALMLTSCVHQSVALAVEPPPDGGYPIGNTAEGEDALFSLTSGYDNVAVGYQALYGNTSGILNTGTGYRVLYANTTGKGNTATGNGALSRNTIGGNNTATGYHALFLNTTGQNNTGEGKFALDANTTGSNNIALGCKAGSSLTTGSNNIDIGNVGAAGETGTLRIGTPGTQTVAYMAGVYGAIEPSGVYLTVGPDGHLGTVASSARFKEEIRPMMDASEAVLKLKPVAFRYKEELDPEKTPQFGLIAEEVEKVNPALVVRTADGKAYTVRYDAVNAMLLNEFLKEHRRVEELEHEARRQEAAIAQQQNDLAEQQKQIDALTATVAKVSNSKGE
jgi:trimeric autotransporter adhesin